MIQFIIFGEPASPKNSRKIVKFGDRSAMIKSDKARKYERDALRQIPALARQRLQCPVRVTLKIYYATERPDLDESLLLDIMQDRYVKNKLTKQRELVQHGCYMNDRLVREKHVYHFIDRTNPRAEVLIEELEPMMFVDVCWPNAPIITVPSSQAPF